MATLTTSYQQIVSKYIGTVSGSGVAAKDLYLRIYAKYNSQSVANNTSSVSYQSRLYVTGSGTYFYTGNTTSKSLSGSGASTASGDAQGNYYLGETTLSTITGTVTHSAAGAASVSMSASWSSTPWGISGSASGSASLPTIPRASSITSAGNVTLGNACSIKWTPASTSFKYKIKFALGGWNYTTGYISPGVTSSYTYTGYTIPNTSALLDDIPNSTTGTMTATLYTYNSSNTQVGSAASKTFTVTVPSSVVPTVGTITLDPADINSQNILVQGKNKLTISVSGCSAGTGSSIKSYTFSGPGISSTTTSTSVTSSGTISNTGTLTYTVKVTDNRGRTASKTATISCYAWSVPSIKLSAYRVSSATSTTEDDNGAFVRCTYNLSYSSVNNTNDVTVKIYYKKNTASGNQSVTALTDSTSVSGSYTLSSIDATSTYTVYAEITDNYGGKSLSSSLTIFGASRALNITKDGEGFAIGKMSEKTSSNTNGLFECKWDAKFYGTATGPSGFSTSSDKRVKKNIKNISANIVDGLRPVQYELSNIDDGKVHYGFVAQEVATLLDNAGLDAETTGIIGHIINNGQQEYVLTYTEFVPLLTKKCQDLQSEIDMLKQEIDKLKNNIVK